MKQEQKFPKGIYEGENHYREAGKEVDKTYFCYVLPLENEQYQIRVLYFKRGKWWLKRRQTIRISHWRFQTLKRVESYIENKLWESIKAPVAKLNRVEV